MDGSENKYGACGVLTGGLGGSTGGLEDSTGGLEDSTGWLGGSTRGLGGFTGGLGAVGWEGSIVVSLRVSSVLPAAGRMADA